MSQHTPGPVPDKIDPLVEAEAQAQQSAPSDPVSAATQAELSMILLSSQPLGVLLRRVAELAVKAIPGADEASVTLIGRGRPRTVAFSGKLAVTLDERQYEAGSGPCLDAAANGQTIMLDTDDEPASYPEFTGAARRSGIRYVLSTGMPHLQHIRGGLNIYSCGVGGAFDPQAREAARSFAGYAAATVFNAALYADVVTEVSHIQQAMLSQAGIEQAKGIIMARQHCTAEEAFAILINTSSRSNRKLRDVAADIVAAATSS
jgi:GAF domain-containing protein